MHGESRMASQRGLCCALDEDTNIGSISPKTSRSRSKKARDTFTISCGLQSNVFWIKTLDLPITGSQAIHHIRFHDSFNLSVSQTKRTLLHKKITTMKDIESPNGEVDKDGDATIEHLPKVRKIADRISSKDYPGSWAFIPQSIFIAMKDDSADRVSLQLCA